MSESAATATFVAGMAVVRQTVESTCYVLAGGAEPGPLHPIPTVLLGALTSFVACTALFSWLFAEGRERRGFVTTQVMLVFLAGGMVMAAAHSLRRLRVWGFWHDPLVQFDFSSHPAGAPARALSSIVGVRHELTLAECAAWAGYAVIVVMLACRTYSARLRLRLRAGLPL